jgi:hypothetical protein
MAGEAMSQKFEAEYLSWDKDGQQRSPIFSAVFD